MQAHFETDTGLELDAQLSRIEARLDDLKNHLTIQAVPIQKQLWSKKEAANYLGIAQHTFANKVMKLPAFPKAVSVNGGGLNSAGHRWRASDVINWAMAQKVTA